MIYLDYAANTPVNPLVIDAFSDAAMKYFGNPNANHEVGAQAKKAMEEWTEEISNILGCKDMEIIYTSGASEANNLAIKGVARTYRENGKHIISTYLEHSSVSGALTWLQSMGYEIDLVNINKDGMVDLEHLRELLRKDTILVSIGCVDGELGVCQPIKEIGKMVKENPDCYFHVDATQGIGKIPIAMDTIDLLTFAPHKFYGLNGMGILLRKNNVVLEPLIHGGRSTSLYRSGTPVAAWAAATAEALKLCYDNLEVNLESVKQKKDMLLEKLTKYPLVHINSTEKSLPHFLNISVKGVKAEKFQELLNRYEVYVSTKSACSVPLTPSRPVFAVTGDRNLAKCSWRISLSHLTTEEEMITFLEIFDQCYKELTSLK